jgi:hypothetical protein
MGEVLPLPNRGEVFLDPRGQGRSLRVSWHREENMLVLSLWQLGQCRATFRLLTEDVPDLVRALVAGLSDGLVQQRQTLRQLATAAAPTVLAEPPTVLVAEPPTVVADEPPTVPVAPPPAGEADVTVPATGAKPDAGGPGVAEKKPPQTPREQPPPVLFQAPPDPV